MSPRTLAIGCGFVVLLAACALTRHGTLTRTESGAVIPVSIVVKEDSVTIHGTNPADGESLEGRLHPDREERLRPSIGLPGPGPPVGGAVSPGVGPRPTTGGPAFLEMAGRLEGDKGTSVRCVLRIEKRLRLRGEGVCRTLEGQEETTVYRIRF